jgi:hypothetical protein
MKLNEQELKMINTTLDFFMMKRKDFKEETFREYLALNFKIKTAIKNKVFD